MKKSLSILYKVIFLAITCWLLYLDLFVDNMEGLGVMGYFTTQSNVLVAVVMPFMLFWPQKGKTRAFVRGLALCSILLTGIVYNFVLKHVWTDLATYSLLSFMMHVFTPLAFAFDWLLFDEPTQMRLSFVPLWCLYPFVYWVCSIIVGSQSRHFLYFFMDTQKGPAYVLIWLLVLLLVFCMIGAFVFLVDKGLGGKNKSVAPEPLNH